MLTMINALESLVQHTLRLPGVLLLVCSAYQLCVLKKSARMRLAEPELDIGNLNFCMPSTFVTGRSSERLDNLLPASGRISR